MSRRCTNPVHRRLALLVAIGGSQRRFIAGAACADPFFFSTGSGCTTQLIAASVDVHDRRSGPPIADSQSGGRFPCLRVPATTRLTGDVQRRTVDVRDAADIG